MYMTLERDKDKYKNQESNLIGRIHSIETGGTVDGPGLRYVVFMQGCPLRCKYCHNPDSWCITEGKERSVADLVEDIQKYDMFMKFSKGGVTVSGGEPLMQAPFVLELFKHLKSMNIHTALDTSGFANLTTTIKELLDYTDLVLLDIKHLETKKHEELTGKPNTKVLQFAEYLCSINKPTWVRYVIVDQYTQSPDYAQILADYVKGLKNIELVELLPYHSMGKYKWEELGMTYQLNDIEEPTHAVMEQIKAVFRENGIKTLG